MEYFIAQNGSQAGPYDMITLLKKIKNGQVTAATILSDGQGNTRPASEFEEVAALLNSMNSKGDDSYIPTVNEANINVNFSENLKAGFKLMMEHQLTIAYSALFTAFLLLLAFAFSFLGVIGYSVTFILGYVLYSAYFIYVTRVARGQHVGFSFIKDKLVGNVPSLLLAGVISTFFFSLCPLLLKAESVLLTLLMVVLVVLGLVVWTLLAFTPLLIAEGNMPTMKAVKLSISGVKRLSFDEKGVILSFAVINFIALVPFIAPFIVTLPITMFALNEIYEEMYKI